MTDTIEDRLRATLEAEADRHSVTPDLAGLRTRGDGNVVVDLRLPPRRNRARILAAAAVVAVLAVGLGAVVTRSGDDGQPVITDSADAPTGWYLPGPGWEITSVDAGGYPSSPGLVRSVLFMTDDPSGFPQASVDVYRTTDPDALAAALVPDGVVQAGADDRPYVVATRTGGSAPLVDLTATYDDLVLHVEAWGPDGAGAFILADQWTTSRGQSLPSPEEMRRLGDGSDPDAPAATPDAVLAARDLAADAHLALTATVDVRGPDGRTASYTLAPTTRRRMPTGAGGSEEAATAGLAPGEVPRTFADAGSPLGPATAAWLLPDGSIVADLPAATLDVGPQEYDPDGETGRALVGALRPVSADEWAAAVRAVEPNPDPALLSPTLAEAPVPDLTDDGSATTTMAETAPATIPEETAIPTVLLQIGRDDASLAHLADEVTVGFVGDTDADVVLTGADRGDPDRWALELDGRWAHSGTASAIDRVQGAPGVTGVHPGPTDPQCLERGGDRGPTDPAVVLVEPGDVGSCLDWFAVVVRVDDEGRITEVRLRLWEP